MVGLETPFDRLWPTLHLVHVALIQLATDYGLGLSTECQPETGGGQRTTPRSDVRPTSPPPLRITLDLRRSLGYERHPGGCGEPRVGRYGASLRNAVGAGRILFQAVAPLIMPYAAPPELEQSMAFNLESAWDPSSSLQAAREYLEA